MAVKQLRLRQLTKKRGSDDRLIPLINVVFLMLIFFLLAGSIRPPAPFDIELPVSQSEHRRVSERPVLRVGANGQLALNGVSLDSDRADVLSDALKTQWREAEPGNDSSARKIEIWADQALPVARLSVVLSAVTGAGADEISLITQR